MHHVLSVTEDPWTDPFCRQTVPLLLFTSLLSMDFMTTCSQVLGGDWVCKENNRSRLPHSPFGGCGQPQEWGDHFCGGHPTSWGSAQEHTKD